MKTYNYELIDGGYIITCSNGFQITQIGDPAAPAVEGELVPFADADRAPAAEAAIAVLQAADSTAGSMRAPGL